MLLAQILSAVADVQLTSFDLRSYGQFQLPKSTGTRCTIANHFAGYTTNPTDDRAIKAPPPSWIPASGVHCCLIATDQYLAELVASAHVLWHRRHETRLALCRPCNRPADFQLIVRSFRSSVLPALSRPFSHKTPSIKKPAEAGGEAYLGQNLAPKHSRYIVSR